MARLTLNNPHLDGRKAIEAFAKHAEQHGNGGDKGDKVEGFYRKAHPKFQDRKKIMGRNVHKWRGEKLAYAPVDDGRKFIIEANFSSASGSARAEEEGSGLGGMWKKTKGWFGGGEEKTAEAAPPSKKAEPASNTPDSSEGKNVGGGFWNSVSDKLRSLPTKDTPTSGASSFSHDTGLPSF